MTIQYLKHLFCTLLIVASAVWAQANLIEMQVNQSIPDGDLSGLASTINLSGLSTPVGNLEVELNISGTYNGDLYAYLTHGSGFTVLLNRVGTTSGNNLGYGDHGLDVTFGSSAPDIHNYQVVLAGSGSLPLTGPLTGTWGPDGRAVSPLTVTDADSPSALLSSFQGLDPNGQWTLFVADVNGGDLHQLNSWSLELNASASGIPDNWSTAGLLLLGFGLIGLSKRLRLLGAIAATVLPLIQGVQAQPSWFHGFPVSQPHPIPAIAAGAVHILGLKADGTAMAAGDNSDGQGNVAGWTGIAAVAAGLQHSVGLSADGSVVAVGNNDYGQCEVSGWGGIAAIAAGGYETLGLKADGTVIAMGDNGYGQTAVTGWTGIIAIAAGGAHNVGLKADGTVVAVGANWTGQCNVTGWSGIVAVSAGFDHTVGLKADGTVVAVGNNGDGECNVGSWNSIVSITAGSYYTVGLKMDGTVVAVGNNSSGQCNVANWRNVVAVAAGGVTAGLKADDTVTSAGYDNNGKQIETGGWYLGSGHIPPIVTRPPSAQVVLIHSPAQFQAAAAGPGTLKYRWYRGETPLSDDDRITGTTSPLLTIQTAMTSDQGQYRVKVSNAYGDSTSDAVSLVVTTMPPPPRHRIAAGVNLTLGLRADGTVISSDGTTLGWSEIVSVATDGSRSYGLKADGTVVSAGGNGGARCDVSTWTDIVMLSAFPSRIVGLRADGTVVMPDACTLSGWSSIIAVAAGEYQTLGLKADGTVLTTGGGPSDTSGWSNIVAIAGGGGWVALGLKADGTVVSTGWPNDWQTAVSSWSGIVAVAAGDSHAVGLKADGSVVAVGDHDNGRCDVGGWTEIVEVAAGYAHTIGLHADGTVVGVGLNTLHQRDTSSWYLGPDGVPPIFTQVPPNARAILGGPFDFGVSAAGPGTIRYQWYLEGASLVEGGRISGSTSARVRIENIQSSDAGNYTVIAANEFGATTSPPIPLQVISMPPHQIPNIAAGGADTAGLKADRTVISSAGGAEGWNDIVAVTTWQGRTMGVKPDGTVVATGLQGSGLESINDWSAIVATAGGKWPGGQRGYYYERAFGVRADGTVMAAAVQGGVFVNGAASELDVDNWRDIVAVAANASEIVGLRSDGRVLSTVGGLESWSGIVAVAKGGSHTLGLKADGTVVAVESNDPGNDQGQTAVTGWAGIVAIAAGSAHSVGLRSDGHVLAVGANFQGQCDVGTWSDIVAVTAGDAFTVGLKADGTVISTANDLYWIVGTAQDTSSWYLGRDGVAPIFTRPPENSVSILGGPARFQSLAVGPGTTGYQWYRNGVALADDGRITGAASATLSITSSQSGDEGDYTVAASNTFGSTTSTSVTLRSFVMPDHQIPNLAAGYTYTIGLQIDGTAVLTTEPNWASDWRNLVAVAAGAGLQADGTVLVAGLESIYDQGWFDVTNWTGITALAIGGSHTDGLRADGTVVTAGDTSLGRGAVSSWSGIVALAAGNNFTVGLKADGTVLAVGANDYGQCNVSDWRDIVAVAAGAQHTVGLKRDGTAVAIGYRSYDGPGSDMRSPLAVGDWSGIIAVAAGGNHTVGLKADGTVLAVGENTFGELEVSGWSQIVAIAAGTYHTAGLRADGTVVAVGSNDYGQLNTAPWYLGVPGASPRLTSGPADGVAILGGPGRFQVAALGEGIISFRWYHNGNPMTDDTRISGSMSASLVIANTSPQDEGEYQVVAANSFGSAPSAVVRLRTYPMPVHSIPNIAAGGDNSVGLNADGTVVAVGYHDATDLATDVADWTGIVAIASGGNHTVGLRADGTLVAVGPSTPLDSINFGQLQVGDWTGMVGVAAGGSTTLGIRADGTVLAVGLNDSHQIEVGGWNHIVAAAGGGRFSVGLHADGTVVAVGQNYDGQCNVSGWTGIAAVAAGGYHTIGLKADGTAVAVGDNSNGQCDVSGWRGLAAVAAGYGHTVGLRTDGTVLAVGLNANGQCNVGEWSGIIAVAAGSTHTLGLKADGTVLAVGSNDFGQCDTTGWNLGRKANQPPVAGNYQIATASGLAKSLPLAKLEQACSDPDGDAVTISAVSAGSAAGGSAQIMGSSIVYTPPLDFIGADSFTYTVSDSQGASSEGTVHVTVTAPGGSGPNVIGVTVAPAGAATIDFAGIPGISYTIEASTDLVHWSNIGSVIAPANGLFEFVDTQASNYPSRYYRTVAGSAGP